MEKHKEVRIEDTKIHQTLNRIEKLEKEVFGK